MQSTSNPWGPASKRSQMAPATPLWSRNQGRTTIYPDPAPSAPRRKRQRMSAGGWAASLSLFAVLAAPACVLAETLGVV